MFQNNNDFGPLRRGQIIPEAQTRQGVAQITEAVSLIGLDGAAPCAGLGWFGRCHLTLYEIQSNLALETTEPGSKRPNRLHNDIQNKPFAYLKGQHGAKNVGTKQDTGGGTSIDVVSQVKGRTTFYEIKTGTSVRSSIRQAIPQLLEYAFWPAEHRAHELVIVSHLPPTNDSDRYLKFLQSEFNLPLIYQQFAPKTNMLK